ncbi:hypothetical protein [uncultured Erythrobacter sp.]|uniref:hypothetical protein n=1 Tax=uncultured Erythrobacter sp. TaxID=263913 RepID=UPI0026328DB3|nr:hypothetical protein [uncultured Erythrobacter sp.]
MSLNRRLFLAASLAISLVSPSLLGCSAEAEPGPPKTKLYVMGVLHSTHLESEDYSLEVLEAAIRRAAPDVILTEIPPDRIDQAITSFQETGEIDEPRTRVFPEYTEVVFPLSRELDFQIVGTAGWTREIADNRRVALQRIQGNPARAEEWAEHRAASRQFGRDLRGRGRDPLFIHTPEYDALVKAGRTPYQEHFDADLGPGGWTQINKAHTDLINAELDKISGQGFTALVTFGSAHKYKILESIEARDDIELLDTRVLFE